MTGAELGLGREAARLAAVLRDDAQGGRGSLLLSGDRGMGRTTTLETALARLPVPAARMSGVPAAGSQPYSSLRHALPAVVGHPVLGPATPRWLDLLTHSSSADPAALAHRLLSELPSAGPLTVLAVDDVHLFDSASQHVLASLAHHGVGFGLRTVLTIDESADPTPFAALQQLRLPPLTVGQVRTMVEGVTGCSLPHRVAALLQGWSGGNPAIVLDLVQALTGPELTGTSPIGLPLVVGAEIRQRLGEPLRSLPGADLRMLALFALRHSLPVDVLAGIGDSSTDTLDRLVAQGLLTVQHRVAEPRRPRDALLAWALLAPSAQQQLTVALAAELQPTAPAVSDVLAAMAGDPGSQSQLVQRAAELFGSGEVELAATACQLRLHTHPGSDLDGPVLAQLLIAEGYSHAAQLQLRRMHRDRETTRAELLRLVTELAAVTSDPSEATARIAIADPPTEALDTWLRAVLLVCRIQVGLDGPAESAMLVRAIEPLLGLATTDTAALARLVTAERAVYAEEPGSPAALRAALEDWLEQSPRRFDLNTMTAAIDLLGLGAVSAARDLLATAGSLQQLPFATGRAALLTLRAQIEMAGGHFRRAAASLAALDRHRPGPSGIDLVVASQAIRVSTVCDDAEECRALEERLGRSPSAVLTYPARRAHSAALGFRELVLGNYPRSQDLLTLALQGPALLLQGRSCVLADLVEATAATGDRAGAAEVWERHSGWLPDGGGDRAAGLHARCRALVAPVDEVDAMFELALKEISPAHEVDRGRTLLAYGRTLVLLGRPAAAAPVLDQALALFEAAQLPGWARHVRLLLDQGGPHRPELTVPDKLLTEMEEQVLALVLQRKRNREIAATLFVSLRTVEGHLTRIFRKLGVATKKELYHRMAETHPG